MSFAHRGALRTCFAYAWHRGSETLQACRSKHRRSDRATFLHISDYQKTESKEAFNTLDACVRETAELSRLHAIDDVDIFTSKPGDSVHCAECTV